MRIQRSLAFCLLVGALLATETRATGNNAPNNPADAPEVKLTIPSVKSANGVFRVIAPAESSKVLRDLEPGENTLKKGEWLDFFFTYPKADNRDGLKTVATIASRLWSATFANLSDTDLAELKNLIELRSLGCAVDRKGTGSGLEVASTLAHLEVMNVELANAQACLGVKHIANVKCLKQLILQFDSKCPEEALDPLADHKSLNALTVKNWNGLTDAGMAKIAKIPNLATLDINQCTKITAKGIEALKGRRLRHLDIRGCDRISDDGAKHIATFLELRNLFAQASGMTDVGVKLIAGLKQLETLDLSDNFGVTDTCMEDLKALKSLKILNVSGTELTDKAVVALKEMKTLTELNVEATRISVAGVEALKNALPNTKINEVQ